MALIAVVAYQLAHQLDDKAVVVRRDGALHAREPRTTSMACAEVPSQLNPVQHEGGDLVDHADLVGLGYPGAPKMHVAGESVLVCHVGVRALYDRRSSSSRGLTIHDDRARAASSRASYPQKALNDVQERFHNGVQIHQVDLVVHSR